MITSINKHLYDLIEKEIKNNLIWYNKENK